MLWSKYLVRQIEYILERILLFYRDIGWDETLNIQQDQGKKQICNDHLP